MIEDLKLGIKLLKYSLQFKMSVIVACIFIAIGLIYDMALVPISGTAISTYYLFGMVFGAQMISSLNASSMVQSSPCKKRLQTRIMTAICVCMEIIPITVMLAIKAVQYYYKEDMRVYVINSILIVSAAVLLLNLYMVMATKFYWSSTIVFLVVVIFYAVFFIRGQYYRVALHDVKMETIFSQLPFWGAVFILYGAVVLGGVLIYVLSNLLYKREYSKMMFKTALERAK